MSVAAALKNVILMMLIILILHFLIKNINMEHQLNEAREDQEREQEDRQQIQLIAVCTESQEEEEPIAVCGEKKEDHRNELQRFVFEEHGELEKFFVPVDNDDSFENEYKIRCDLNLIEKHKVEEVLQRTVSDNKKESRIDALSFLNEFTPQKPPLGDDELMAYDSYGSKFGNACGNAMTPWDSPPPDACQRSL